MLLMGKPDWDRIEKILDQALKLPEEDRFAYLEKACEGQPKLKREVELMLISIKESKGWLENPEKYIEAFFW